MNKRRTLKHKLIPKDEPVQLKLGCLDKTNGEWLSIGLFYGKKTIHTDLSEDQAKFVRECLKTQEGKEILFGAKKPGPEFVDLQELTSPSQPTIGILANMGLLNEES